MLWFAVSIIGYGILFSLGSLQGSIYINGYINAGANLGSYFVSGPMANWIGRKESMILFFFIAGVACVLYNPLSSLGLTSSYICLVLGTFGSTSVFNLVYIVTSETFPTVYRGTMFGVSNMMARVGGMLAPLLDGATKGSFMYIFGGLGLVSSLLSFLLKETKGKVMADTVEEE